MATVLKKKKKSEQNYNLKMMTTLIILSLLGSNIVSDYLEINLNHGKKLHAGIIRDN